MTSSKAFTFSDLFCGIGGIRIPFEEFGGKCVFSSEIDRYAIVSYAHNFGHAPDGDITEIDAASIPDHDILTGGFPCQAFSIIGNRRGFQETRGTLFHDVARIIDAKKPRAFLLENVKNLKSHDGGKTFEIIIGVLKDLGYHVHSKVLNALDYGLPQKRERTIIVGFREETAFEWPEPVAKRLTLADILDPAADLDPKLQASTYIQERRLAKLAEQDSSSFEPSIWHENKAKHVSVLPYSVALRRDASYNYILVNGKRRPSGRELLRLQGFPESFEIVVPLGEIRKQTGNAVPVPMIRAVAAKMISAMEIVK